MVDGLTHGILVGVFRSGVSIAENVGVKRPAGVDVGLAEVRLSVRIFFRKPRCRADRLAFRFLAGNRMFLCREAADRNRKKAHDGEARDGQNQPGFHTSVESPAISPFDAQPDCEV